MSERGIGGTGSPAEKRADRGIGGTGIVGVITGFGSVWVDGLEVRYDASSKVDVDGAAASPSDLHIGDVVAIRAAGPKASPMAQSISVRHELIGRIEAMALDTGIVTIAGQPVAISSSTSGADKFGLGDWVSASGLRREDGVLVASRLDPAQEGLLTAHGQAEREDGVTRVGNLVLPADAAVEPGQYVTVIGTYTAGHGHVAAVRGDALPANPGGYFGANVTHLVVQGFLRVNGSTVRLNGVAVNAGPGLNGQHDGLAVVSMERWADGSLTAVGVRYTEDHAQPIHGPPAVSMPMVGMPSEPAAPARMIGAAGPAATATPVASNPAPGSTPVVPPRPETDGSAEKLMPPTLGQTPLSMPTPTATASGTGSGPVIARGTGGSDGIPVASNGGSTTPAVPTSPIPKTFNPVRGPSLVSVQQPIASLQSGPAKVPIPTALSGGAIVRNVVQKVPKGHLRAAKVR